MSVDRAEFVDDRDRKRIPEDAPLREIAPDDFVARSSGTTLRAALIEAERQTSRDEDALPRCPECGSIRIRSKPGQLSMPHKIDEHDHKCTGCGKHFSDPAPSREDARPGDQSTLPGVRQ